jgi:hypothetical protein
VQEHRHDRDAGNTCAEGGETREQPNDHGCRTRTQGVRFGEHTPARVATPGRGIADATPADDAAIARAPRRRRGTLRLCGKVKRQRVSCGRS